MLKLVQKKSAEVVQKTEDRNPTGQSSVPSHLRFAQIYDLVSDGIRIIDTDFNILYMNRTYRALSKPGIEVLFGAKCYDVFDGKKCHTEACPLRRLEAGEQEIKCRVVRKCADGTTRKGTSTSRPLWGANKKLAGLISGFHDITEVEEAHQALEEIQRLLESEAETLEAKQTALKEVLDQIEDERTQMSLRIRANLDRVVVP